MLKPSKENIIERLESEQLDYILAVLEIYEQAQARKAKNDRREQE